MSQASSSQKMNPARQGRGQDHFTRHKTRYRGVIYRETDEGRTYYAYAQGKYHKVIGGEREARDLKAKLDAPGRPSKAPRRERFENAARQWLVVKSAKVRPWTLTNYQDALERVILPRFGKRWLHEIATEDIAALIHELAAEGKSKSTIQNYLKPLNGTFSYAVRHGMGLAANPYAGLTSDDWPRSSDKKTYEWSDREIAALLDAASESSYPLIFAAVNTGLRLSELLGLRWRDVEQDVIHVRGQLSRSGSHEEPKTSAGRRRVPLFDDVAAFFEARRFAATYQADNDPVFAHVTGEPLQHRGVQRGFDNARDKARESLHGGFSHDDGRPVTFHDLRHAFASRCASRGVPVETLSAVMGHTNVGITQSIYLHLYGREEAEARFREAMNGKSLASTDPEQPQSPGVLPETTKPFEDQSD